VVYVQVAEDSVYWWALGEHGNISFGYIKGGKFTEELYGLSLPT
jgi:hypothetical protein